MARGGPPSVWRTALGGLFAIGVLALAVWLLGMLLSGFVYDSGLAGTPGAFVSTHCHTEGAGKSRVTTCTGTFTSADGRFVDPKATVTDAVSKVGKPIQLRRKADGGYAVPGSARTTLDLAGAFGVVAGAAFLLVIPCLMVRRVTVGKGIPLRSNPPPWGVLLPLLVGLWAGFMFLAGVTAVVGLLILFIGTAVRAIF